MSALLEVEMQDTELRANVMALRTEFARLSSRCERAGQLAAALTCEVILCRLDDTLDDVELLREFLTQAVGSNPVT